MFKIMMTSWRHLPLILLNNFLEGKVYKIYDSQHRVLGNLHDGPEYTFATTNLRTVNNISWSVEHNSYSGLGRWFETKRFKMA